MSDTSGKVAILGGSGLSGLALINEALYQGYTVRALVRDPAKLSVSHRRLELVEGNADDSDAIETLVQGCSAVISTLGPTGKNKAAAKAMICSTATGHLIEKMGASDLTRYILVSAASLVMPADKRTNLFGLITKYIGPLMLGDIIKDKKREYRLLAASDLNWTLVRCPSIKEGKYLNNVKVNRRTVPGGKVRTGELARFLVEQLVNTEFDREGIFVASV